MRKITVALWRVTLAVSLLAAVMPLLLELVGRTERMSTEKYNLLLQTWSEDPDCPDDRYADFPDFYGGAYIDKDKSLVIQVTRLDGEVEEYFRSLIDMDNVRLNRVDCSLQELFDRQEAIDRHVDEADGIAAAVRDVGTFRGDGHLCKKQHGECVRRL